MLCVSKKSKQKQMIIERKFQRANKWTFQIPAIKKLLNRYVGNGTGWIDPFSGESEIAVVRNDFNFERTKATHHMLADKFCEMLDGEFDGILFDPPYSYRQIKECYEGIGFKASQLDTSFNFYNRVMIASAPKIKVGGYAISFGWNSNGFGKNRGFEIVEILMVPHGGHHHDTICTVERKKQAKLL